jgi:hypothetical protein
MADKLVSELSDRLKIDEATTREALGMMMEALHENDDGELAGELEGRFPSLGELEPGGSGGGALASEAAGLVSGTPNSGLHGLTALIGKNRLGSFMEGTAAVVGQESDPALGEKTLQALRRIIA